MIPNKVNMYKGILTENEGNDIGCTYSTYRREEKCLNISD